MWGISRLLSDIFIICLPPQRKLHYVRPQLFHQLENSQHLSFNWGVFERFEGLWKTTCPIFPQVSVIWGVGSRGPRLRGQFFLTQTMTHLFVCLFVSFLLHQMTRQWHCQGAKSHNTGCATECQYFHLLLLLNNIQNKQQNTRSLYKSSPSLSSWQLSLRHSATWTHLPNFAMQSSN